MYSLKKAYNKQDASERQVMIKVLDIDDNLPKFVHENITLGKEYANKSSENARVGPCTYNPLVFSGVRVSVPLDTLVTTVQATDVDSSSEQITFHITNLTYTHRPESAKDLKNWPFSLDQSTGQIRTTSSMVAYAEGHFDIVVAAINSDVSGRHSNTTITVRLSAPWKSETALSYSEQFRDN